VAHPPVWETIPGEFHPDGEIGGRVGRAVGWGTRSLRGPSVSGSNISNLVKIKYFLENKYD
jgi:hypothetical protein